MDGLRDWLSEHKQLTFLSVAGGVLVLGLFSLVTTALGTAGGEQSEIDALKQDIQAEIDVASDQLDEDYTTLVREMGGVDIERVDRDRAAGRELMLSLSGTSASRLDLAHQQALLKERFGFLEDDSQVLASFLPEWLNATSGNGQEPVVYEMSSLDTQVVNISGLKYGYFSIARLDPVTADGEQAEAETEFLMVRYSTEQNGQITSVDAWRAAPATRDALLAAETEDEAEDTVEETAEPTETPDSTTTPTPTSTPDDDESEDR